MNCDICKRPIVAENGHGCLKHYNRKRGELSAEMIHLCGECVSHFHDLMNEEKEVYE